MESEELIYSGRWSRGYKKGNQFIKELRYYEPSSAERESRANRAVCSKGINTPRFISLCDDGAVVRMSFEWKAMNTVSPENLSSTLPLILGMLNDLKGTQWASDDRYWEECLLKDFSDALSHIGDNSQNHFNLITSLEPGVFIHGDFSLQNIGLSGETIYLYDFQHSCIGPQGWDLCYFAGSLEPSFCRDMQLSDCEKRIACAIAAVKLGRALRRNSEDKKVKQKIYHQWREVTGSV